MVVWIFFWNFDLLLWNPPVATEYQKTNLSSQITHVDNNWYKQNLFTIIKLLEKNPTITSCLAIDFGYMETRWHAALRDTRKEGRSAIETENATYLRAWFVSNDQKPGSGNCVLSWQFIAKHAMGFTFLSNCFFFLSWSSNSCYRMQKTNNYQNNPRG